MSFGKFSLRTVAAVALIVVVAVVTFIQARAADAQPAAAATATKPAASGRVFEMRKYYVMPGKLDALHARFRDHTIALFEKHGMENIGHYWVPTDGPEAGKVLIYILAYPSQEAKEAAWKGFVNDPVWKKAYADSHKDGKLVEKIESTMLTGTDYSAIK